MNESGFNGKPATSSTSSSSSVNDACVKRGELFILELENDSEDETSSECSSSLSYDCGSEAEADSGYRSDLDQSITSSNTGHKSFSKSWSWMKAMKSQNRKKLKSQSVNDSLMGTEREVILSINPHNNAHCIDNFEKRVPPTVCERLLGIVPGTESYFDESGFPKHREKIIVNGLSPNGPAVKCRDIHIGDWLKCVNDLEVTWQNLESLLSAISSPKKVKLKLIRFPPAPQPVSRKKNVLGDRLVQLITGERLSETGPPLSNHYGLLYLSSPQTSSGNNSNEIVYRYPPGKNVLCNIRGSFLTMSQVIHDVTHYNIQNSTVVVEEKLVHVSYHHEGRDVVVLAAPAERHSPAVLKDLFNNIIRILRVLFGSVESAFSKDNVSSVDHFLTLFFQCFIIPSSMQLQKKCLSDSNHYSNGNVQWLPLPHEIQENIGNAVSDFESADYVDMGDSYYGCRRLYTILGSCLFHKGYLLCNHLPMEDFSDIYLYLKHYCLLVLSGDRPMSQLVVWKEIYPTRRCHDVCDTQVFGFSEPFGRWFLLVVGLKYSIMATLLEIGGCSAMNDGEYVPDPFLIDQAKATLMQINSLQVETHCKLRIKDEINTKVTQADTFNPKRASFRKDVPLSHSFTNKLLIDEEISTDSTNFKRGQRKGSFESTESSESSGSDGLFRVQRKARLFPPSYDMTSLSRNLDDLSEEELNNDRVKNNSHIFHYVYIDNLECVYISPPSIQQTGVHYGPVHTQVLKNFSKCCDIIKDVLNRKKTKKHKCEPEAITFGSETSLMGVREHGVMFQCEENTKADSSSQGVLNYWVVGRQLTRPSNQEVFVCFHESTPENTVELAFNMSFGMDLAPL